MLSNCHSFKSLTSNSRPSEIPSGSCSCCFNQPDNYCTQLECLRMQPDFGKTNHTSCICYNQANYPHHICASSSPDQPSFSIEQWSGGVTQLKE
uniref:Uncharacterized protein n=1 Tax=Ditylenchus dipsaci TaxID=166011 RepID=A0A915DWV1_9BILA